MVPLWVIQPYRMLNTHSEAPPGGRRAAPGRGRHGHARKTHAVLVDVDLQKNVERGAGAAARHAQHARPLLARRRQPPSPFWATGRAGATAPAKACRPGRRSRSRARAARAAARACFGGNPWHRLPFPAAPRRKGSFGTRSRAMCTRYAAGAAGRDGRHSTQADRGCSHTSHGACPALRDGTSARSAHLRRGCA